MDCQPIVTYAGDRSVFSNIEPGLVSGLPTEAVEWKRSYGRNSRQVYVEVSFQPFSAETVISSGSLQGQPVFHTFWTDVADIDLYRQGVKDDILTWLNTLKKSGVTSDWMIVVVETPENRKGNKFPLRATVLDKLKQDVGGKTPDKCVALLDPSKADSRAAESMQSLLHKFRQGFLQAYNKVLNKFEENIRSQREKRTEASWNFCQYFLLQEQLAFVYENMGLFDESLIQYDELDALFTQFVLNSNVGESPTWLDQFNKDLADWTALSLDKATNMNLHAKLENNNPSLLDMRNYLFSRQCSLLLLSKKPQEVAGRTLSFLHNTIQELDILEVEEVVEGSLDSWVLLACLEVVQTCDAHLVEGGSGVHGPGVLPTHTASLWSAAREKLLRLGQLCGLMPDQAPTSDQLHRVISITGGLQEVETQAKEEGVRSPIKRLKESLSSNSAFQRNYLEMCEITISSYKHIGRIRSARLVGKDLATFYMQLGQVQQAATFLAEALKTFQVERWDKLSLQTMLDLTKCYEAMGDKEKYVRMCAQIASNKVAAASDREHFFGEITKTLDVLGKDDIYMHAEDIVDFISCQADKTSDDQQVIPGSRLNFSLVMRSNLPRAIPCTCLKISLSLQEQDQPEAVLERKNPVGQRRPVQRSPSVASNSQLEVQLESDTCEVEGDGKLDMVEQLDYKQDKSLCAARLVCRNSNRVLKRKDSSGSILRDASQLQRGDFSLCLEKDNLLLEPGTHTYKVETVASQEGKYIMTQMSAKLQQLDLIHNICTISSFTVTSSPPTISLNRESKELFAGLESTMVLSVSTGSKTVEAGTRVCLTSSRGMMIKPEEAGDEFSSKVFVSLPAGEPFQTISVKILVKAVLSNQKDSSSIEHKVTISNPWSNTEKDVFVHFIPAFYTTFQLLTAMDKKFLQIFLYPLTETSFSLSHHQLVLAGEAFSQELSLKPINREGDVLVVNSNCEGGYLWELNIPSTTEPLEVDKPVKILFSLAYKETGSHPVEDGEQYGATFQFQNFLTLYTIQARVEPAKGNEFCRAGTMCPMTVQLEQCNLSPHTSLFYEVIADQAMWAVCGRQGAVVNIAQSSKQNIVVEVMPLVGGHLFLPAVRLSKYIPADSKTGGGLGAARLDPFATGQVYNMSRSQQVHVLPPLNQHVEFVSLP
eukprot:GFUD01032674.1.p1 GENE.GFUD01032674.1~~GFUD01032674.1.p1  ORF type:complete len:1160 (-),score=402.30 GFUD01032674.1:238-3717(-)